MFALMSPLLWRIVGVAAILAALAALVLGYGHRQYGKGVAVTTAAYEAALSKQKVEAAQLLAEATGKVLVMERRIAADRAAQEVKDADNKTKVAALSAQLRAAAGTAGGLRDPFATGCRPSGGGSSDPATASAPDRPADPAPAGRQLSAELEGFLIAQAEAADAVNIAYAACRADAYSVRQ